MPVIETISQTIIQQCENLLHNSSSLMPRQQQRLRAIHRSALDFLRAYHRRHHMTETQFAQYLKYEAISPVTLIIGYSELLLMGFCGTFSAEQQQQLEALHASCYQLQEQLQIQQALYPSVVAGQAGQRG